MNSWKNLKGKLRLREPLEAHTTFKIGGPAKYFIEPKDINDLRLLLALARAERLPVLVIGSGSNILAGDKGVNAAVISLNSPAFKKISFQRGSFTAGAGCMLSRVIRECKNRGLSAFEIFSGIPGRVGGALVMNAGVPEKNIGDLVEEITVMDYNGKLKELARRQIKFAYRSSRLAKYVVLAAKFGCCRKKKQDLAAVIRGCWEWRRDKQELSLPSAGCVFKNPAGVISAGRLIDLCGLKGRRIGDAAVSARHANFIVNMGNARAKDVLRLMRLVRQRVKNKFNIDLQPEIKIWQ